MDRRKKVRKEAPPMRLMVILDNAGLYSGRDGIVDGYERGVTVDIANTSLHSARPDIVHQCLLALFDSELASLQQLQVYISTVKGKTIEVSPSLRPPRTFHRFKGLMESLLRDGKVVASDGQVLLSVLPGSVAPLIPYGCPVVGLCNSEDSVVMSAREQASTAVKHPVKNELQGGVKNIWGVFCVSCTDDANAVAGLDYITTTRCLSAFPTTPHVLCARLCEGFAQEARS